VTLLVGWQKDPYDKRDLIRPIKPGALPSEVNLIDLMPEVRDQGRVGSCVGFGVAANLCAQAKIDAADPNDWFSPTWIYNGARFIEGDLLHDVGAYPRSALSWIRNKGSLLERFWPYNPNMLDTRTPPSSLEPEAAKYPVYSYARVTGGCTGIASALAEGKPVTLGTPWYDKWMFTTPDGRLAKITTRDAAAGGHATIAYGYTTIDGEIYFRCQNSWGKDWGDHGRFLMPASAFSAFTSHGGYDAYTIDVRWDASQPPPPTKPKLPDWLIFPIIGALAVGLYFLAKALGLIEILF
jgi:hypothetical protein